MATLTSFPGPPPQSPRIAETRLLYRITKDLTDPEGKPQQMLDSIVGHLADYGFQRPTLALLDPKTDELRVEASRGLTPAEHRRARYQRGTGLVGRVALDGKAAVVSSFDREATRANAESGSEEERGEGALICVPIPDARHEPLGTLAVERPAGLQNDLQWDRRLLAVVARLISEAVRRCFEEREEAASRGREQTRRHTVVEHAASGKAIVGASHAIREVFRLIEQVAPFDTAVLLRGESGTGKELVANAIHEASARATGPFICVNCGALPEPLVESELFGHMRGAYTGAVSTRRGRFELANGGTLFLDEVGELAPPVQVKLLRALQAGEIHRVGEESARRVDVRLVAATNADLERAIAEGRFREDLYYRLNVFPVFLPPLRERRTDITQLADHFVEKYSKLHRRKVVRISTPAIELMMSYHWPGNVRELENCIARAVLLSEDGVIRAHHLPPTLQTGKSSGTTKAGSLQSMMMAYEREILIEAMKNAGGNMTAAARALETTPRILGYRLHHHGLHEQLAALRHKRRGQRV